ncbi:peptidoglycan D,D-transpeptidase FtsI family protein [Polynucleobacter sphagniphilus]|jgi:cell division protein FtsI (penicillin-binding protein 3)|uniref:peptidoglycan D,D-transpeptidase FtsI family protein n=1 Tax=Polynucleobacter sphagniphilus TaxID=1743169 RepID=UPI00096BB391|nr:penicillin-binding protein 2 [Polynucleobacter sphagniphilus]MDF9787723.1 cell division protein FtsI (penicillin-binding protein 3) [Polynucleobacter sphagniphilus]MDH6153895.1 cell division protein FtsI (penicillin-binding protein 3) [Polynucleobacter sphagniphilus]MDH6248542.1 cell division protein FtsI (penicillin-binding protein 3) [Polynucleobacter sphagniphilus]MDH6302029.1 cell division protein FtsI (penicillin-binding protein 3) [Polynucleobacter sphagniphilus]MDH6421075.1 cell divi
MRPVGFSTTPNLVLRLPMWRSRLMLFLLFFVFMMLLLRAFWIQGPGNAFYEAKGVRGTQRELELPASRGKILDRNGQVIATSLEAKSIIAYIDTVPDDLSAEKIHKLAALLQMNDADLRKKLREERKQVFLKRQVEPDIAQQIKQLEIPGIGLNNEYRRFYPEGEAMAHVVGFTNVNDQGQEGIEYSREDALAGHAGQRRVVIDRLGRVVEEVGIDRLPQNGKDLQLSVDSKIQYIAYNAVKNAVEQHHAKAGSAVVLDTQTGEILALANYPSYNPNDRRYLTGEQLRNRALTDMFEPGSTIKPFTVSTALEKGVITPSSTMVIGASYLIGKKPITDTHPNGTLTIAQVIQKSSNIGAAKIAMNYLTPEEMWDMYSAVGFGQAPKIGFRGAVAGTLHPYKKWAESDQARIAFGYGLSGSLFQVARAYTIFARDGELVPITIERSPEFKPGTKVISPKTAQEMRAMLETVTLPGGTAVKAQVDGYRVGGKTGTAHKLVGKGYGNKYLAYFAGIAPISAPRISVAVMIDEPTGGSYYGGDVAAPVFSTIVSETLRTLNVLPDITTRQASIETVEPAEAHSVTHKTSHVLAKK